MAKFENKEAIKSNLTALNNFSRSIEASAVMTRDGFPVVTLLSDDVDADRLSAMSASMLSLAEKAVTDLKRGNLEQVMIHSSEGFFILVKVNQEAVLSVISKKDTKLGMLLLETQKAARSIAKHFVG